MPFQYLAHKINVQFVSFRLSFFPIISQPLFHHLLFFLLFILVLQLLLTEMIYGPLPLFPPRYALSMRQKNTVIYPHGRGGEGRRRMPVPGSCSVAPCRYVLREERREWERRNGPLFSPRPRVFDVPKMDYPENDPALYKKEGHIKAIF